MCCWPGRRKLTPHFKPSQYSQVSARAVRDELIAEKGYSDAMLPSRQALVRLLNRLGYRRKTSFGAQSQGGSQFVARMLTVTTSLKMQGRNILDFLTQACLAKRTGEEHPSLLPKQQR